jgi:hypothetical protein
MENKKYLELMQKVIWSARLESREKGNFNKIHDMMDIIENIPGILIGGGKIDNSRLLSRVLEYEEKYLDGEDNYSRILNS